MKQSKTKRLRPKIGDSISYQGQHFGEVFAIEGPICIIKTERNEFNSFIWRFKKTPYQEIETDSEGYYLNPRFNWGAKMIKQTEKTIGIDMKKLRDKLNASGIDALVGIEDYRLAALIAAAPEMLKALEAILEDAENFLSGEAQVNLSLTLVEAAIAKAKGGE